MSSDIVRLEVVSAPAGARPGTIIGFDASGGSIGRSPGNTLHLPDQGQQVSRIHAQIVHRAPDVRIVCRAINGLRVDGAEIEFGEETSLQDGASVEVGGYRLRASIPSSETPADMP